MIDSSRDGSSDSPVQVLMKPTDAGHCGRHRGFTNVILALAILCGVSEWLPAQEVTGPSSPDVEFQPQTHVDLREGMWTINGAVTYPAQPLKG